MYADDLILLTSSVSDLQTMLQICDLAGRYLGIEFNPSKSKYILISPNINIQPSTLSIGQFQLPWVDKLDYLGITLTSANSFTIDLSNIRRKFFTSVNSILSKCTFTSDMVKLCLLESHCLPILLYATESLNLPKSQITVLNSWWNSVYRKIFNYHKWESVRSLISLLGRLDLHHIINLKTLNFIVKMSECPFTPEPLRNYLNNVYKFSNECTSVFMKFNCYGIRCPHKIKRKLYDDFNLSCTTPPSSPVTD